MSSLSTTNSFPFQSYLDHINLHQNTSPKRTLIPFPSPKPSSEARKQHKTYPTIAVFLRHTASRAKLWAAQKASKVSKKKQQKVIPKSTSIEKCIKVHIFSVLFLCKLQKHQTLLKCCACLPSLYLPSSFASSSLHFVARLVSQNISIVVFPLKAPNMHTQQRRLEWTLFVDFKVWLWASEPNLSSASEREEEKKVGLQWPWWV